MLYRPEVRVAFAARYCFALNQLRVAEMQAYIAGGHAGDGAFEKYGTCCVRFLCRAESVEYDAVASSEVCLCPAVSFQCQVLHARESLFRWHAYDNLSLCHLIFERHVPYVSHAVCHALLCSDAADSLFAMNECRHSAEIVLFCRCEPLQGC